MTLWFNKDMLRFTSRPNLLAILIEFDLRLRLCASSHAHAFSPAHTASTNTNPCHDNACPAIFTAVANANDHSYNRGTMHKQS